MASLAGATGAGDQLGVRCIEQEHGHTAMCRRGLRPYAEPLLGGGSQGGAFRRVWALAIVQRCFETGRWDVPVASRRDGAAVVHALTIGGL